MTSAAGSAAQHGQQAVTEDVSRQVDVEGLQAQGALVSCHHT